MNACAEVGLEDRLSEPIKAVMETLARLPSDILFLEVAGKMGPSMARVGPSWCEAAHGWSGPIHGWQRGAVAVVGVETIRCDLLDEAAVARLPDAPNVFYLAGRKFGSTGDEPLT